MDYTLDKLTTEAVIGCENGHGSEGSSGRGAANDHRVHVPEGESSQLENPSGVSRLSTAVPLRYSQNQRNDGTLSDKLEGYTSDIAQSLPHTRKEQRSQDLSSCYENKQKAYGSQYSYSFGDEAAEGAEAAALKRCIETPLYPDTDIRSVNWLSMRNKDKVMPSKDYTDKPGASGYLPDSLEIKEEYHSGTSFVSGFKYARATQNNQVLNSESAQLKNYSNALSLNQNLQFSALNFRDAVQFSDVPESWNLLSPENYRRQPEPFVSNSDVAEGRSKSGRFGEEVLDGLKQLLPENGDSQTVAPPGRCDRDSTKLEAMSDLVCDNQNKIKDIDDGTDSKDNESTIDEEEFNANNDKIKTSNDIKKEDNEKLVTKFPIMKPSTLRKKIAVEDDTFADLSLSLPAEAKRFPCEICKKSWKFRKGLNKHMKTHVKRFSCSLCNSDFSNKSQLNKHLQTHADSKLLELATAGINLAGFKRDQSIVRAFPCGQCQYKAKQKKDLTKHMKVHTTAKVHRCQLCDFSSKRRYSLHRHLKAVHSIAKMYECTACDFKVDELDIFKAHIAEHSLGSTTPPTNVIGPVLRERANLTERLLNESMSQKTKCKKCEEIYFSSVEFMHHILSHKRSSSVGLEDMYHDISPGASSSPNDRASSRLMMEASTDELKMSHMSTIVSRLADVTKTLNLLGDASKGASELVEISNLATELVVISDIMLPSFKNRLSTRRKTRTSSMSRSNLDDSSFMDDDFEFSSVLDVDTSTVKEECVDKMYPATVDINMQIQVDFNGEAISCVQKDHIRQAGEPKKVKHLRCSLCNLVFTDTCGLKRHLLVHVDARPWLCKKCGQSFRRKEHLKKHMVTHSADRPFVCEECQYGAKTEDRLKIHISCCHARNKQFACQFCSYSGRTGYDLSVHMKRHKPQNCSQCSFICYSRAELRKHLFTHSSFDCGVCDFTTTDRIEYTRHAKKHSMIQFLCCELCGYSCDTLRKFKYHKLRHENKTPFECPDCEYKCSSRASYDCHRLKHAGLKPFLCSFCGSSFIKSSHLNQHMLIHKDEKSFKCSVCGYCCRTKHNMKEHEMTHSGEKPYVCKYCNFSSRRKKALLLHMLKHEGR